MIVPRDVANQKAELRSRVRAELSELPSDQARRESAAIARAIVQSDVFLRARAMMLYIAMQRADGSCEVDLADVARACIESGRTLCLPRVDWKGKRLNPARVVDLESELVQTRYGLHEPSQRCAPVSPEKLDLILVPGIAFDVSGNRLGHGEGFYDRFLSQPGVHAFRCGPAFRAQLLELVPSLPHDVPMHAVATADGLIRIR